jgi:hypothetical protein
MLVTVSECVESLGLAPVLEDQMEGPLLKAISKAQLRLEEELSTRLDQFDHVEVFHADSDVMAGTLTYGMLCLRLNNGFVVNAVDSPLIMEEAEEWRGPFIEVPVTEFQVNWEKGLVYLDPAHDGNYIKVSYRAGFKKASETPTAIKQALFAMLPATLTVQNDGDEQKNTDKSGMKFAGTIVNSLKRPTPVAFRPYIADSIPV